jgi:hypothetical protein
MQEAALLFLSNHLVAGHPGSALDAVSKSKNNTFNLIFIEVMNNMINEVKEDSLIKLLVILFQFLLNFQDSEGVCLVYAPRNTKSFLESWLKELKTFNQKASIAVALSIDVKSRLVGLDKQKSRPKSTFKPVDITGTLIVLTQSSDQKVIFNFYLFI